MSTTGAHVLLSSSGAEVLRESLGDAFELALIESA
jgi:hypothetical protein